MLSSLPLHLLFECTHPAFASGKHGPLKVRCSSGYQKPQDQTGWPMVSIGKFHPPATVLLRSIYQAQPPCLPSRFFLLQQRQQILREYKNRVPLVVALSAACFALPGKGTSHV